MVKVSKTPNIVLCLSILLAAVFSTTNITSAEAASIPSSLRFSLVTGGLTNPDFITNAGDGSNRLFILQQTGQIMIYKNGGLLVTPFLNISGLVPNFTGLHGEQGLLSLAFDPNYSSNGFFYITYTTTNNDPTFLYTTTLARYQVSSGNPDLANTGSGTVLLSIPKKYTNHNGGMIAFGPDGYLYMSMGDGGSGGDPDNNAQNLHTMLGKLLRLDVHNTPPAGKKYVVPATNPFYGSSDTTIKKEIWAYGLRNPWRFSFDRSIGDLYIGDVGQNREEEVDFQSQSSTGGQNYGWRILEGNLCYNPATNCTKPSGYVPPVAVYDHGTNDSYGCSLTGGYVYRGSKFSDLQGVYFYGDYCSGKVLGLIKNPNNTWTSKLIVSTSYSISSFGQDEQGELYLADYGNGRIYHIMSALVTISGNTGVPGVTLSYTDGALKKVISDNSGNYSIRVPAGWTGTVTPSRICYTFTPANRGYSNLLADQSGQNYSAAFNGSNCGAGVGTYDDTDSHWVYAGTWKTFSGSGPYNNTLHYTVTVGDSAFFPFNGTQFSLRYTQYPNRGSFEVYVDGNKIDTINANGTVQWQTTYTSPTFAAGTHEVQFKNIGGSGNVIDVDAITIFNAAAPGVGKYDDGNANWSYSGIWKTYSGSGPYSDTLHYTVTVGDSASFPFNGTQFIFSYTQYPNRGSFEVYVDGNKIDTINANGTTEWQKTYTSPIFASGTHVAQFKNIGGSGSVIDVDAIEILDTPAPGAGTYDDTDSHWVYAGTWKLYSGSDPYNNTLHYTTTVGNTASFPFNGTQFIVSYTQYPNRGSFEVYVDGNKVTTINANGTVVWQKTYTSTTFSAGTHIVQLKNIGGSSGTVIDVDAITIN